jgi:hypothetical protein
LIGVLDGCCRASAPSDRGFETLEDMMAERHRRDEERHHAFEWRLNLSGSLLEPVILESLFTAA